MKIRSTQNWDGEPETGHPIPAAFIEKLLDCIDEIICVLDKKGHFQYVSKASFSQLGYWPEEMLNAHFKDFMLPADADSFMSAITEELTPGEMQRITCRCYHKNGSSKPVLWLVRWCAVSRQYYGVIKSMLGKSEIENQLVQAQQLARVASFEYDLVHHCYLYTSASIFNLFGIDQARYPVFTTELFWRSIHPDDLPWVKQSWEDPAHLYNKSLEYRIVRPNGQVVHISRIREIICDEQGRPYKAITTLQDVTDCKQAKMALMESEQRLKALVDHSSALIAILDTQGHYTYVAGSAKQVLGYESLDLLGKNALDLVHPDDQAMATEWLEAITTRKFVTLQPFRFRNAEGNWRWVETKVANFTDDPAINGLVVNSSDITERKISEDQVSGLSIFAEKSNQAVMITDKDQRITWVNGAFTRLSDYTFEDAIGKLPPELFAGQEVLNAYKQAGLRPGAYSEVIEICCKSKKGRQYWVELQVQPVQDASGQIRQFVAIGKDITKRKQQNDQLVLSEQMFKSLVQNSSDVIVILDAAGTFKYISHNVQQLIGYTAEDLLQKNAFDYIPDEEREQVRKRLQKLILNSSSAKEVQHRFRTAAGGWVWLESKGANHMQNPSVQGLIVNVRNISDRVRLQQQLEQELQNKQKEVTAAVINAQEWERSQLGLELHDNVNQVLTTVKLYNEMFLAGYEGDRALIEKSTVYLQECINEIRSISKRLSAPTLGSISLHDTLQELIDSLILTRQIEILYKPYDIAGLNISKELHLAIYRIIQEGLNNVIKYAEASTVIIAIRNANEKLAVTIYDNGKGFDTRQKKSGIGITNMRTRAENLNGTFELNSSPGNGCIIKLLFPLIN